MPKVLSYGTNHSFTGLKPMEIERQPAGPTDVEIDILYCGVCHSDVHQAENDWSNTVYPCVPGHEIVGRVARVGDEVSKVAVGDLVGVGCMVDSCGTCHSCADGEENYCESPNSFLATYNGPMKPADQADGTNIYGRDNTFGGYSTAITVKETFVLKVPEALPIERAAPILCAGITTFSPLRHWNAGPGKKVGVIGLGGLGDMAVKLAVAMGAEVYGLTTSKDKVARIEALGATPVVAGDEAYEELAATFDLLVSTIPKGHKVDDYLPLLKRDGSYVAVGAVEPMPGYDHSQLVMGRKQIAGSLIGGIAETQEVLDFCAEHGIAPDVTVVPIQDINDVYKKLKKGDVEGRYVIDMASLKKEEAERREAVAA